MKAFFGFRGRDIADWRHQAPVIEPIYPFQHGEFHGHEAAPRPAAVNDLGFVKPVDSLSERVVAARADAADRGFNPGLKQPFRIFYRDILGVLNRSSQHPFRGVYDGRRQAKIRTVHASGFVFPRAAWCCASGGSAEVLGTDCLRPIE
jgi:hypothetical protein